MIIPIDQLEAETLRNIVEGYVLREGTDYGEMEMDFATKVNQVIASLQQGEAVLVYSELHDSIDIKPRKDVSGV